MARKLKRHESNRLARTEEVHQFDDLKRKIQGQPSLVATQSFESYNLRAQKVWLHHTLKLCNMTDLESLFQGDPMLNVKTDLNSQHNGFHTLWAGAGRQ